MRIILLITVLYITGCMQAELPISDEMLDRPVIGSYYIYTVALDWIDDVEQTGYFQINRYGTPFSIVTLEELDAVLNQWNGWNMPYDKTHRNCVWFAYGMRLWAQGQLGHIPFGVITINYKYKLTGHAAGLFVECLPNEDKNWRVYPENYNIWICDIEHGDIGEVVVGIRYSKYNAQEWVLRFIDMAPPFHPGDTIESVRLEMWDEKQNTFEIHRRLL